MTPPIEFTCKECGAAAYFAVTGNAEGYHTEVRVTRDVRDRCEAPASSPAPMLSDGFQCPHLLDALSRALAAKGE